MCLGCLGFGLCFLVFEYFSVFHVKRLVGAEGGSGFT